MAGTLSFLERSDWKYSANSAGEDVTSLQVPGDALPEPPQITPPDSNTREELRRRLLEMIRRNEALRKAIAR